VLFAGFDGNLLLLWGDFYLEADFRASSVFLQLTYKITASARE
jgi:hypothetical protein